MHKLNCFHLSAAVVVFAALLAVEARSAELEGALQYPPPSVGEDAQPPPPAGMVPQLVSPRRIELGFSGSSPPPAVDRERTLAASMGALRLSPQASVSD
jgi:hypothetical protein